MPLTVDDRLSRMKRRRQGLDRLDALPLDEQISVLAKSIATESWQTRQSSNKNTQYVLGAMQSVGSEYTEITIRTAERVGKQLNEKLKQDTDFRLQGSVPLDVHIRGVSDVDLLVLDNSLFLYDTYGPLGNTYSPSTRNVLDVILSLRRDSETVLKTSYPAVKVDCSGGKAIKLTGGSLPRPVDVVPSVWYKTAEYQRSSQESDAGIVVADKSVPETIDNRPFTHIKLVNERDQRAKGGLKKAVRLLKNIKADSERAGVDKISSFDITSLLYHANVELLALGQFYELSILAELQRFLDWVYRNKSEAVILRTPDNSRTILNSAEKYEAVRQLSFEVDEISKLVAAEQKIIIENTGWDAIGDGLRKSFIV